jgi:aldose 1-epimerase
MADSISVPADAGARRGLFGLLEDGARIEQVELSNGRGLTARIITLGAALQGLEVPDRDGRADDVVLGYPTARGYLEGRQYFGATVGRFANRIAHGRFRLDGETYQIPVNNGPNALHGGARGFDKRIWAIEAVEDHPAPRVVLSYLSPDGEEGFPGALSVEATYALTGDDGLEITYRAITSRPTVVNLSSHSYWNLGGEACGRSVLEHELTIHAQAFTPVDETLIPTGELRSVAGGPFDFRRPNPVGRRIGETDDDQIRIGHGYDHNFALDEASGALRPIARLADPQSGRVLNVSSTTPGLQVYSAGYLDGSIVGKGGVPYQKCAALCLEPQGFPDAPNQPSFPSARLDPGRVYESRIVYHFTVASRV